MGRQRAERWSQIAGDDGQQEAGAGLVVGRAFAHWYGQSENEQRGGRRDQKGGRQQYETPPDDVYRGRSKTEKNCDNQPAKF